MSKFLSRLNMSVGKRSKSQVNKVRAKVFDRDDHTCIVSGSEWAFSHPCFGGLTIQHSCARGMGSSAKYDGMAFLRTMCAGHNALEPANPDFQKACERNGWKVRRWVADNYGPNNIPVLYPDGWYLLSGETRHQISQRAAEAIWEELHDSTVL